MISLLTYPHASVNQGSHVVPK